MIKYAWIVFLTLFCLGCQGPIKFVDTADGKYKEVLGSHFDVFIVRDKEVFKDYHSLILLPIALDAMEIDKETEPQIARSWQQGEETKRLISDYYSKAKSSYENGRGKHSFSVVNNAFQGVMAAEFRIRKFRPYVSRDGADMANIVTETSAPSLAQLTLEITIVDAISGEFIAHVLDGRHVAAGPMGGGDINKAKQAHVWRLTILKWFNNLDKSIDKLKVAHQ